MLQLLYPQDSPSAVNGVSILIYTVYYLHYWFLLQLLYPKDSLSAFSGVSGEILCRGRDYIMWRFTQSRYLVRKDITSVIKLPAEDVKDVLEQMAALKVRARNICAKALSR